MWKNSRCKWTLGLYAAAILSFANAAKGDGDPVRSILDQIPSGEPREAGAVLSALITPDGKRIQSLCERLVPPGEGDDTKERFALHGLAIHVMRPGGEGDRRVYVKVLAETLEKDLPVPVKDFLIRQLHLAGQDESVDALSAFLDHEQLYEKAAQALVAIGSERAVQSLRSAVPEAQGQAKVHLLHALGVLADQESLDAFLANVHSEESDLRLACLHGLANLGDPAARRIFLKAIESEDAYERAKSIGWTVLYAKRLAEEGHRSLARKLCKKLMRKGRASGETHVECSGLFGLADVAGGEAVDELLSAVDKGNLVLRTAVLSRLAVMEEEAVTEELVKRMSKSSPELQSEILGVLAKREDPMAIPAVLDSLKSPHPSVRLAAIPVSASLAGVKALPSGLLDMLDEGGDEAKAAREAILSVPGREAMNWVAGALKAARSAEMKVPCIEILAERASRPHLDLMAAGTRDPSPEVRKASAKALGELGGRSHLPDLIVLLEEDELRSAAEKAISSITTRLPEDRRSAHILSAMPAASTEARCSLLRVLGRNGDPKALSTVREALRSSNQELKDAAVRALADWPNDEAIGDLLALAKNAEQETHRILAFRGYADLLSKDAGLQPEEKARRLGQAMSFAPREDEKRVLLGHLGRMSNKEALLLAASCLEEEKLKEEAAVACVNIAKALLGEDPQTCADIMETVLAEATNEDTLKKARSLLADLNKAGTYLAQWIGAGPYKKDGKSAEELFDVPFPAEEKASKEVPWKDVSVESSGDALRVDLIQALGPGANCIGYLKTRVFVPQAQEAVLAVGSDDGIKVILNGETVLSKNEMRSYVADQDEVKVRLDKEWNTLLLKVTQGGGDWRASARLYGLDGQRIEGMRVKAE